MDHVDIKKSADEMYKDFTKEITGEFRRENDIEFTIMLLSLGYDEKEIKATIVQYSPCAPNLSNKARDYGPKIFKETEGGIKKGFKKKRSGIDSASQALKDSLNREVGLCTGIEFRTAQIIADLLLQGFEREEILEAIEAELEHQNREQLLKRLWKVEKAFKIIDKTKTKKKGFSL
jgi:hypothetical protein